MNLFGWGGSTPSSELPDIFPFIMKQHDFVRTDVINIYARILTDVLERTEGVPEEKQPLLWDNCLGSEMQDGLVTLLCKAMTDKTDLYLVYDSGTNVIMKADSRQAAQIRSDYAKDGKSSVGIYVTFKNFHRSDFVKLYSTLEYFTVASLWKGMNLSKAVQLKLSDLRGSVGLIDSADVKVQGKAIADSLAAGKDIMIDAKDMISTSPPDLTATNSSLEFIAQKQSFYLGMPASYITGAQTKGIGDTGQGDARATERGYKGYFFSIVKPIMSALFDINVTFQSEDFQQLEGSLDALKAFDITSNDHLSKDNKTIIVNKLFGLPDDEVGDPPEEVPPPQFNVQDPLNPAVKPPGKAPPELPPPKKA